MPSSKPSSSSRAPRRGSQRAAGHLDDIAEEVQSLGESLRGATDEAHEVLAEQASTRPYLTLGAAAGAGFVLAGGLTPKISAWLLSYGGRMLLGKLGRSLLSGGRDS